MTSFMYRNEHWVWDVTKWRCETGFRKGVTIVPPELDAILDGSGEYIYKNPVPDAVLGLVCDKDGEFMELLNRNTVAVLSEMKTFL